MVNGAGDDTCQKDSNKDAMDGWKWRAESGIGCSGEARSEIGDGRWEMTKRRRRGSNAPKKASFVGLQSGINFTRCVFFLFLFYFYFGGTIMITMLQLII